MAEPAERRNRVTVIDDHPEFLDLMAELLSARYEVVTFSGAQITPDEIIDSRPDLLIVDLRLGRRELQGQDLVSLVRAHAHLARVPIVICSADAQALKARAAELLGAGNVALLAKPFTLTDLEEVVDHGLTSGYPGGTTANGQYDSLLANSTDPVLVADHRGRCLDANDAALGILGLTLDELRARSIHEVVTADQAWTDAAWQRYLRERSWQGPVTISTAGARTQRMLATARIVDSAEGPFYVSWLHPMEDQTAD